MRLIFCFLLMSSVTIAQDFSVSSTASTKAEIPPGQLVLATHKKVKSGQIFSVKIRPGIPYKIEPEVTPWYVGTDERTGEKVLFFVSDGRSLTVSAETKQVRISEQELKAAPSFNDPEGYIRWMSEHKVDVKDSKTVDVDRGLSEFARSVRNLARRIESDSEVKVVARNFGVIATAIESGEYGTTTDIEIPVEGVYLLNRGSVSDETSKRWNVFFSALAKQETYQDIEDVDDVRSVFVQIQQGLEASLE